MAIDGEIITFGEIGTVVRRHAWRMVAATVAGAALALGVSSWLAPYYTAQATLLPPRHQQASTALSSLGVLAGAVGAVVAHTAEQYVAFLSSRRLVDRVVERFDLARAEGDGSVETAARRLLLRTRFAIDRREGSLRIAVTDDDGERAAAIANAFVEELQRLSQELYRQAVVARELSLQRELAGSRQALTEAEKQLRGAGFSDADQRLSGRVLGDQYRALQSQVGQSAVRVQVLQQSLGSESAEVRTAQARLDALRGQLLALGSGERRMHKDESHAAAERQYRLREEAHLELLRQLEQLRVEQGRGAPPVTVLDAAMAPERRSGPRRLRNMVLGGAASGALALLATLLWAFWRPSTPVRAAGASRLGA